MVPSGPCSSLRRIHRTAVWAPICLGGVLVLWGAWGELEAQAYLHLSSTDSPCGSPSRS